MAAEATVGVEGRRGGGAGPIGLPPASMRAALMGEETLIDRLPILVEEDDNQASGADPLLDAITARPAQVEIGFALKVPGTLRVVPRRPPDGSGHLHQRHPMMHSVVGGQIAARRP